MLSDKESLSLKTKEVFGGTVEDIVLWIVFAVLLASLATFLVKSRHWGLVNDGAQMDYACFLVDHGMSPYRDLLEMNMPGTYMVHWAVMHGPGTGDAAWRSFDLSVAALAGGAMVWIAWPTSRGAGVYAGMLFALFHGRDGPAQAGQRDLVVAMLLLWTCAFLFLAVRKGCVWPMFLFGIAGVAAVTLKPVALITVAWLLTGCVLRHNRKGTATVTALGGMAVPLCGVWLFLQGKGALKAFAHFEWIVLPYYGSLARLSTKELLQGALTPSLVTLLLFGLVAAWRRRVSWESTVLLGCAVCGLLSFVVQGKGFAYHRYSTVGFVIAWVMIELNRAVRGEGFARAAGWAGLVFAGVLGPLYAVRAGSRVWDETMTRTLMSDLKAQGGMALSGDVQCFATMPDCDTALLRLHLVQTSGLMYDYLVFGDERVAAIREARQRVLPVLQRSPPKVVVVGRGLYPKSGDYSKIENWPEFASKLRTEYRLVQQREFAPAQDGVRGYRFYVRQ